MPKKSIMRANKRTYTLIASALFSLIFFAIAFIYMQAHPVLSDIELLVNKERQNVELPYKADTNRNVPTFELELHVSHNRFSSGIFHIVPDDCLSTLYVNDSKVDLSGINGLCNWSRGFDIDISRYLVDGDNRLQLRLKDKAGKRGVDVKAVLKPWIHHSFKAVVGVMVLLASFFVMRYLRFSLTLSIVFALGMVVRFYYFMETPWYERTYDVDGHIDYIVYIATHGALPMAKECWTCYHPPLYYLMSAGIYKMGLLFSKGVALSAVQFLSLIFSWLFALFSVLSLRLMFTSRVVLLMSSTVILFYPSLLMHASRIGNDVLVYVGYVGAFYFYLKWLRDGKGIWLSTLFAAMALFAKANGLIVMAVLGMAYLIHVISRREWKRKWRTVVLVASVYALIAGSAASLHVARSDGGLVSNAHSLNRRLFVDNSISSYLYFDPAIMLKHAYTSAWDNGKGREYFWNYFWQSSLFGEFGHDLNLKPLASGISAVFLVLLMMAVVGFFAMRKQELVRSMPFIMNAIFIVLAAIYLRYSIPAACSNDFRYSIPLILSLAYFMGLALSMVRRKEIIVLEWGIYATVALFALFSSIFVLNL